MVEASFLSILGHQMKKKEGTKKRKNDREYFSRPSWNLGNFEINRGWNRASIKALFSFFPCFKKYFESLRAKKRARKKQQPKILGKKRTKPPPSPSKT
jgi:hypothetical protein